MLKTSFIRNFRYKTELVRVINAIIVITLIINLLTQADQVLTPPETNMRLGYFYENDQDYDVLFFGSSHMLHSINSMQLWNEYGIRSYNLSGAATWTPTSYWVFKNAIRFHKPKAAVLEVFGCQNGFDDQKLEFVHGTFDAIPLSLTKLEGIRSIRTDKKDWGELVLPFSLYHTRWETLNSEMVNNLGMSESNPYCFGSEFLYGLYDEAEEIEIDYKPYSTESDGVVYIKRFIETCKDENIIPVLLYNPYNVLIDDDYLHSVNDEAVTYIDLYQNYRNYINFKTDFYDRAHLNFLGCNKTTSQVGNLLHDILGNNLINSNDDLWHAAYEQYVDKVFNEITNSEDLCKVLLLCSDKSIECKITISEQELAEFKYKDLIEDLELGGNVCIDYSGNTSKIVIEIMRKDNKVKFTKEMDVVHI